MKRFTTFNGSERGPSPRETAFQARLGACPLVRRGPVRPRSVAEIVELRTEHLVLPGGCVGGVSPNC